MLGARDGAPTGDFPTKLKTKLPRVTELDDGRYAFDVEPRIRILFWREGDRCRVKVEIGQPSEHAGKDGRWQTGMRKAIGYQARAPIRAAGREAAKSSLNWRGGMRRKRSRG